MLTEVATGPSVVGSAAADAAHVAAAAEEARMLRRDATAMVERMAVQARTAGLEHPVAAAVALAIRVSALSGPETFAERIGLPMARLVEAESGAVRFGELPAAYDRSCAALDLDPLSLADLESQWERAEAAQGCLF